MKNHATLIFLFIFFHCSFLLSAQDNATAAYKKCDAYQYKYINGVIDTSSVLQNLHFEYDLKGNIIYKTFSDDRTSASYFFTYDSLGNCIEKSWHDSYRSYYDGGEGGSYHDYYITDGGRINWTYNTLGDITEKIVYDKKGLLEEKFKWYYNDQGKMTKKEYYDKDENLDYIDTISYNEKGNITRAVYAGNKTVWKTDYFYDEQGRIISKKYCEKPGNYRSKTTYKYDDHGNLLITERRSPTIRKTIEYYDTLGNRTGKDLIEPGNKLCKKYRWEYDTYGNKILDLITDEDDKIIEKTTWTFDEKGLLKEEITYNTSGIPEKIIMYKYSK